MHTAVNIRPVNSLGLIARTFIYTYIIHHLSALTALVPCVESMRNSRDCSTFRKHILPLRIKVIKCSDVLLPRLRFRIIILDELRAGSAREQQE